jgi:hypothetical protein
MKDKELEGMIERADEMIPKKKGILDPKNAWEKEPSKKIIGQDGEIIPNKYLNRFKDITTRK